MRQIFRGTWVALVTPFAGGRLDEKGLERLVERVVAAGVDGLVPCGCTGEAGALSPEERAEVLGIVRAAAGPRIPVVAGTGTQSTRTTIELTRQAAELGARAAMVITPYYVKPTQEGLYQHYRAVVAEAGLPVMLYNVPSRTGVSLDPETVVRLAELDGVVAIKEASGSPDQVAKIASRSDLPVLSGDDALTLPLMAVGARGVVSVAANVLPTPVVEMVSSFAAGRAEAARKKHYELAPLFRALFRETNPAPAKAALALLEIIKEELRLPLVRVGDSTRRELAEVLRELGEAPPSS